MGARAFMDTNSSKMLSTTTPFSINDILTRNNTSIFRRIPDESNDNPINIPSSGSASAAAFAHSEFQKYRRFQQQSPPSDSRSEPDEQLDKVIADDGRHNYRNHRRHSPIEFYYNNNNNNESRSYHQTRVAYEEMAKEKELHRRYHQDDEKLDYYSMGHQGHHGGGGGETPLDMRRCTTATSNDSGEFLFCVCVRE